jgi:hypothetical protein
MKTLDQIESMYKSQTIDGRGLYRLAQFIPQDRLYSFGLELKDGSSHDPTDFTRENVLKQLEKDVAFGFEKALDQRGISSSLMFKCVQMWNWILEEGLENWSEDDYAQYGLPLFKATANKYGFQDEIEGCEGNEVFFATDYAY